MTNKSKCCNAAITDHLTFIDYHGEGRTNFICCSACGKAAGDGLYQKSQQGYEDEMLTGTVTDKRIEEIKTEIAKKTTRIQELQKKLSEYPQWMLDAADAIISLRKR